MSKYKHHMQDPHKDVLHAIKYNDYGSSGNEGKRAH